MSEVVSEQESHPYFLISAFIQSLPEGETVSFDHKNGSVTATRKENSVVFQQGGSRMSVKDVQTQEAGFTKGPKANPISAEFGISISIGSTGYSGPGTGYYGVKNAHPQLTSLLLEFAEAFKQGHKIQQPSAIDLATKSAGHRIQETVRFSH